MGKILDGNCSSIFINASIYPPRAWDNKNGMERVTHLSSFRICLFRARIADGDVSATRGNGDRLAKCLVMGNFADSEVGLNATS